MNRIDPTPRLEPIPAALSRAERWTIAAALLVLLLQAAVGRWPALGALLEYRRELLAGAPWRLVTAHLVHVGWGHALVNVMAWLIVARLFAAELGAAEQALVALVASIAISLGLAAAFPGIAWYRGLSGVLHALFAAGAAAALVEALGSTRGSGARRTAAAAGYPVALLAGAWIKVGVESVSAGASLHPVAWLGAAVVTQAHLIGAAFGTAAGIALGFDHRIARRRGR
ncbi:MAG TPA: rhombosortase [Burkholderiaceae bacterium]|nr:rhombosortase [Burkholderiaceae bacterium]